MFRRIHHLIIKEFIQAVRDPKLRIFLILPPIVQLLTYGYAVNFDIKNVRTAIYDESGTTQSRELIRRFGATDYFQIDYFARTPALIRELMDRSKITFNLRIPYDFSRKLNAEQTAPLQLLIDGTDSNAAMIVGRYAAVILNDYGEEIFRQRLSRRGYSSGFSLPLLIEEQTWFNPNRISSFSFVPGVIAMVVMLISIMMTALSVVREKEIGTMEQLLVTPMRPIEFILGKTIPFTIISLLDVVLVTLLAIFWFGVPFRGNLLVLLLGVILFLFFSVGIGLFISTVTDTQQQAVMVSTFFFTPAILLSGLVFPIHNMPEVIQYITYINPLRYFIVVVQDIFLKGVGLAILWPQIAAMGVMGIMMLLLSALRFRTRLA